MLAAQGIVSAIRRPRAAGRARFDFAGRGTRDPVRRHVRRSVLLRRAADRAGLRRGCRRPASHGAQPQRHRHDDVSDASAGVHRWALPARLDDCAGRCSIIAERHRETVFAGHTHTQPAQPTTVAHYLLAVIEQLERDARRLRAAFDTTNQCPLGACAITGTGFPIDRGLTADLLGFAGPTGNTYGSIATVDYLLESAVGGCACCSPGSDASCRICCSGPLPSSATCGSPTASYSAAASCRRSAIRLRSSTRARSAARRSAQAAGDSDERSQHAVRRHRGHRGRSPAARVHDVPRRDACGEARRRRDERRRLRSQRSSRRGPPRLDHAHRAGRHAGAGHGLPFRTSHAIAGAADRRRSSSSRAAPFRSSSRRHLRECFAVPLRLHRRRDSSRF